MRPATEYHDARRMLIKLLRMPDDGPVDISGITDTEREFLSATCAHTVALYTLCFMAGFDAARAEEGYAALTKEARKMIYGICDEELPNAAKN